MNSQAIIEAEFMIAFFNLMAHHPNASEMLEIAKQTYEAVHQVEID